MATIDILREDPTAKDVAVGVVVFREGDEGDSAFVVTAGEIELTVEGAHLAMVGVGGILGEMAILDRKTRTTTATTKTDCTLVPLDQRHFLALIQKTPYFAIEVMTAMAERLRRTETRL